MKLQFQIYYKTFPGQQLRITGSNNQLGEGVRGNAPFMHLADNQTGLWVYEIEKESFSDFTYRYFVNDDNFGIEIEEWGPDRRFVSEDNIWNSILFANKWRYEGDAKMVLESSTFLNAVFKQDCSFDAPPIKLKGKTDYVVIRFKPSVSRIKSGHRLAVTGDAISLGLWNEENAVKMGNSLFPIWDSTVEIRVDEFPVSYKYLLKDESGKILFWEKCENRKIELPEGKSTEVIEITDDKFDFPGALWKGAGVAIPVFSLRRQNGFGVGEFSDLKLLVDWASETGIKLIQILPVNDTVALHSWKDSYPYAAISVYAMHPIYINLNKIGKLNSEINQEIIETQGKHLNTLAKIDYEAVMALKSRFFKLYFDQCKHEFLNSEGFKDFFHENVFWLKPYAAFSYLRDLFKTPDFSRWEGYSNPTDELIDKLTNPDSEHYSDIAVHYFIQYHAFNQLLDSANYARSKRIALKGDIPIGIYRNSVDAWVSPGLFHMDRQAGAPPDDFSVKGQNWRFPTYNWEEMAKDNYSWWQQRLRQLSGYFDAFRIDHILGFFRIWEIPSSQVEGILGYFNPSIPYSVSELENKGIRFDAHRFCMPYIREHFLYEKFGELTEWAKQNCLELYSPGCYNLKKEYDTQAKVEEKLNAKLDSNSDYRSKTEHLVNGLNSLIAEVLFIKAPDCGDDAYFPRNSMHSTRSYQELDHHTKFILDQLYIEYFYKRNEELWRGKAMTKLPVIKRATNMLLCGEDLGMVPACVPDVMNELGILSLEVQRMPKNPKITFGHPADYPYLSVATPSSHDTSTIRGWWEENYAVSQKFYNEILGNQGEAPYECTPEIIKQIIVQHLYSPAMWAIFPIQDLLGIDGKLRLPNPHDERINVPANPTHYWRYRMHLNLEDLPGFADFNSYLKKQIQNSGRLYIY